MEKFHDDLVVVDVEVVGQVLAVGDDPVLDGCLARLLPGQELGQVEAQIHLPGLVLSDGHESEPCPVVDGRRNSLGCGGRGLVPCRVGTSGQDEDCPQNGQERPQNRASQLFSFS